MRKERRKEKEIEDLREKGTEENRREAKVREIGLGK